MDYFIFLLIISKVNPDILLQLVGGLPVGLIEFYKCKNVFFWNVAFYICKKPSCWKSFVQRLGLWGCPWPLGWPKGFCSQPGSELLSPGGLVWAGSCTSQGPGLGWAGSCTSQGPALPRVALCCLLKRAGWTLQLGEKFVGKLREALAYECKGWESQTGWCNSLWNPYGIPSYPVITTWTLRVRVAYWLHL